MTRSGACYSWGYNDTSLLGKSGDSDEALPFKLMATQVFPATRAFDVSIGGQHMAWLVAPDTSEDGASKRMREA